MNRIIKLHDIIRRIITVAMLYWTSHHVHYSVALCLLLIFISVELNSFAITQMLDVFKQTKKPDAQILEWQAGKKERRQ